MSYLGKTTGANLPGRGLINPAFVIKIVPATDDMQQQPSSGRDNPVDDYLDNLKVGAQVEAKIKGKHIQGRVNRVIKNELGDGVYVEIQDTNGKIYKVDGSRISVMNANTMDDDRAKMISSPALFNENKFLSFNDFINL